MKVKVLKEHPYAGVLKTVGEVYEMEDGFVQIMEAYGNVKAIEPPVLNRRDVQSDTSKKYKRRDMKVQ